MFIALAGVGIDDGESGVKVGSCFCYLGGEVGQMGARLGRGWV
jgi:hypothetical protein